MPDNKLEFRIAIALVAYILVVGIGAATFVIVDFPTETTDVFGNKTLSFTLFESTDRGLLLLAMLSGIAGSFLHTAQSLSSYIGNKRFRTSWTVWYVLRPWIGGVLGLAVYAALRAGLVPGEGPANPYGVVAFGLLGGWFSKTTTDKLQEVYNTLFKTDEDKSRKDKLYSDERPVVAGIAPETVAKTVNEITIYGSGFREKSQVLIDGHELTPTFVSSTELRVDLTAIPERPAGRETLVQVLNPKGTSPLSEAFRVQFG